MDPRACGLKPTIVADKAKSHGNRQDEKNGGEGPKQMDPRDDGLKKPETSSKANMHDPGKNTLGLREEKRKWKTMTREQEGEQVTLQWRNQRRRRAMQANEHKCNKGNFTLTMKCTEMLQLEIINLRDRLTYQNHQIMELGFKGEMRWEKKESRWR
ncbi:hypothetical protein OIU85_007183 [Salix viminalis]|uniref:Uncharacterized protein n=1 Tax=Salix viminalis TaxID=40686 RepID=A0A9Q0P8A6_SALVM|nr:hypothetical protein OIU85_007183 [Salix viminalis]